MAQTKIEWTATYKEDRTVLPGFSFNPWIGCTRVSPGCQHCYAETLMADRYKKVTWGPTGERVRTSPAYWKQPLNWNREAAEAGVRRRVFCASLADVFEKKADQWKELGDWREELWQLVQATPHLDWLVLTKRPENVREMVPFAMEGNPYSELAWPDNLWIGVSVENQQQAEKRIPLLLEVPAAVRFLSCEPLLGPVDLGKWMPRFISWHSAGGPNECEHGYAAGIPCPHCTPRIHWVIVGGESGRGARPMHPEWARDILRQCRIAEVPFFFKQQGEWALCDYDDLPNVWVDEQTGAVVERASADPEPPPFASAAVMKRVGKKAAGRRLIGFEWNEFPQVAARSVGAR